MFSTDLKPVPFLRLKTDCSPQHSTNGGYSCCIRHSSPAYEKSVLSIWLVIHPDPQRLQATTCSSSLSEGHCFWGKRGRKGQVKVGWGQGKLVTHHHAGAWSSQLSSCLPALQATGTVRQRKESLFRAIIWGTFLVGLLPPFSTGRILTPFTSVEGFPLPAEAVAVSQLSWTRHCNCISASKRDICRTCKNRYKIYINSLV